MLNIRRSWDHPIFKMSIPILVRRYLYIETPPQPPPHPNPDTHTTHTHTTHTTYIHTPVHWHRNKIAHIPLTNYFGGNDCILFILFFLKVQLPKSQHFFRKWMSTEWTTSYYLEQCWSSSMTAYGITVHQYIRYILNLPGNMQIVWFIGECFKMPCVKWQTAYSVHYSIQIYT